MGCDGGTIPRRDELVRMKKKPEQKDKDAERSFKWRNCALSQQRLQEPLVACGLGRLYSKSSVLETLLEKETKPESISHIKNLKDIKDLKLYKNPAYIETDRADGAVDEGSAPYLCPISGLEMTGKFRFVFLWSCGCVLAERALKEVKQNICHMCQTPFAEQDVVVLNGTDEDHEQLKVKMANRSANRKIKKNKSIKTETTAIPSTITSESTEGIEIKAEHDFEPQPKVGLNTVEKDPEASPSTVKKDPEVGLSTVQKDPEAGPSTVKKDPEVGLSTVQKDPEAGPSTVKKDPAAGPSKAVKKEMETIPLSLPKFNEKKQPRGPFGSSKRAHRNELVQDPSYKKTKKDYSIAKDPKSSEVYKSLFTSHRSDKEQKRAHWVTYNPFYN